MVKFLIAGHGYLADGIKSTISIIMGDEIADQIMTLNGFVEDGSMDVTGDIEKIINSIDENDKIIIFSDLMHGSINQFLIPYIDENRIYIISGINFPLVCEIISKYIFGNLKEVNVDDLKSDIEKARQEIIYVNDYIKENSFDKNDDEFFG
ncbi:PTS sugar transporter subunit IIA [Anaerorhabdus sp.]|uniref:PTS sugar transporter subunit IIA n=1 Tax=Anaerorhabdus sp. TaxID=1872524 RepID=UPI002FCA244F